ncbi:MAG: hypothetical protein ACRETT_11315 [Steroidobacteraceae bacterium]
MKRNDFPVFGFDPELAHATSEIARSRSWLPASSLATPALDGSRWRTRAARGFSWNARGTSVTRTRTH